jgi:hypothetical protein
MNEAERAQFIKDIAEALRVHEDGGTYLTTEERQWVKLAIQSEAQSIQMRKAIIEKTLAGLVWAAIVAIGYLLIDYAKNHGWKP